MSRRSSAGIRRAVIGLLLAAFNLRIGITAIGPVVDDIRVTTGMSAAVAGLLTALPFLCMGAFALAGSELARRHGFGRLLVASLGLIAAGGVLRVLDASALPLLAGTVPIGAGIAFIGVVLPGVVRHHFPDRGGAATGYYVAAGCVGGAAAAILAVPISTALGGWQWALALTTAPPAALALVAWPWLGFGDVPRNSVPAAIGRPGRVEATLGLAFGLETACFAAAMAWVSPLYEAAGWTTAAAAAAAAVILLVVLPGSLIAPARSDAGDRAPWIIGSAALLTIGLAGMALLGSAGGLLWLVFAGFGFGSLFTLLLALPVDLSSDPLGATRLGGWMQCVGYALAAVGPVLTGALSDLTGEFTLAFVLLAGMAAASGLLAVAAIRFASRRAEAEVAPVGG